MSNINTVTITGNLTADPEVVNFSGGGSLTKMRVAVNGGYVNRDTKQFIEKVSYFDVEVGNNQAAACAEHLSKGRPVAISGQLEQQRWETDEGNRSKVVIKAQRVQFLGAPASNGDSPSEAAPQSGGELVPAAAGDDDIPF